MADDAKPGPDKRTRLPNTGLNGREAYATLEGMSEQVITRSDLADRLFPRVANNRCRRDTLSRWAKLIGVEPTLRLTDSRAVAYFTESQADRIAVAVAERARPKRKTRR